MREKNFIMITLILVYGSVKSGRAINGLAKVSALMFNASTGQRSEKNESIFSDLRKACEKKQIDI